MWVLLDLLMLSGLLLLVVVYSRVILLGFAWFGVLVAFFLFLFSIVVLG